MKGKIFIYGLYDEEKPNQIRYVGKTICMAERLKGHISKSRSGKLPVHKWIRSLARKGKKPKIKELAKCTALYWEATECHFIRTFRDNGHPLLNVAGGGGANYVAKRAAMASKLVSIHHRGKPSTKAAR